MKLKFLSLSALLLALSVIASPVASAHVVVTPSEALAGERTTFSVSVPNEKDVPVTGLKVDVPASFESVTATVHAGWTIETVKDGERIKAIVWSGGEIPVGQRDDFTFRAQVPADVDELRWNAYETYADGTTVSWNQEPTDSEEEGTDTGPYSVTKVSDEASDETVVKQTDSDSPSVSNTLVLAVSLVALVASVFALLRKRA